MSFEQDCIVGKVVFHWGGKLLSTVAGIDTGAFHFPSRCSPFSTPFRPSTPVYQKPIVPPTHSSSPWSRRTMSSGGARDSRLHIIDPPGFGLQVWRIFSLLSLSTIHSPFFSRNPKIFTYNINGHYRLEWNV